MTTGSNPAIELLVSQIEELERKANAYRASVNVLCVEDGLPPRYPDGGGNGSHKTGSLPDGEARHMSPTTIRSDIFYGKPQQTAVRDFLAIRKTGGAGPAKPAEILEGLRAGGYQVQAGTDEVALVGLRAMLRKRSTVFHKLPNGAWGLREWYPNAKPVKSAPDKAGAKDGEAVDLGAPDKTEAPPKEAPEETAKENAQAA
jgi:hypothetical protein